MKYCVAAAMLALTLGMADAASAQVYGTNDDPYQANPFASNMTVPETPPPDATPTSPPPDSASTQQQAAASAAAPPAKKPAAP